MTLESLWAAFQGVQDQLSRREIEFWRSFWGTVTNVASEYVPLTGVLARPEASPTLFLEAWAQWLHDLEMALYPGVEDTAVSQTGVAPEGYDHAGSQGVRSGA